MSSSPSKPTPHPVTGHDTLASYRGSRFDTAVANDRGLYVGGQGGEGGDGGTGYQPRSELEGAKALLGPTRSATLLANSGDASDANQMALLRASYVDSGPVGTGFSGRGIDANDAWAVDWYAAVNPKQRSVKSMESRVRHSGQSSPWTLARSNAPSKVRARGTSKRYSTDYDEQFAASSRLGA